MATLAPHPLTREVALARPLPRWPFAAMFALFPVWWLLGLGETAWIALAAVMLVFLVRRRRIRMPRGLAIWLMFLVWMGVSAIEIDTPDRMVGFVYRALLYLTVTVIFLYVYNAGDSLSRRYVMGVLTVFWLIVIAGGYVGVLFPLLSIQTPLGLVIPPSIGSNELVQDMVVRSVSQYNPDGWAQLDPRPSAPFLYTNGWGNAYSMLSPIVIAYLVEVRRERRFWWLLTAIPVSLVPAFLTLNRGMFLGLGLALVYVAVRLFMRGSVRALLGLIALVAVIAVAFATLPITERLTHRVESSPSASDRADLYQETFERVLESPVFGYGAPRPSATEGAPSVGTQGQFWMVLFSHGFPGAAFFMGWLVWAYIRSIRERDPVGLALNAVLLVVVVESLYYGIMTAGLAIAMIAAALAMRPPARTPANAAGGPTRESGS